MQKSNITIIIQARLNSTRLPGKVLKKISNKTVIEIIHERISKSKFKNQIIFAIPNNKKNSKLKNFLKNKHLDYFEGSEKNVLDRYYKCAKKNKSQIIVRITADCPLIDSNMLDKCLKIFIKEKIDMLNNVCPPTFPDGLDISIFNYKTLHQTWKNAKTDFDKEHVTPFMLRNKKVKKLNYSSKINFASERWTLDTEKDLIVIKNIFKRFKDFHFSWKDVLKIKKKFPEDFIANQYSIRNEGINSSSGQKLWKKAINIIPGGCMLFSKNPNLHLPNLWPTYYSRTLGSKIWDLDNKKFLDMYLMGVGTNMLGYNNAKVDRAVKETIQKGNLSSLNSPEEVKLAEKLIELHPWAHMVRFTRSGGEANAVAIRIARAATNRTKIAFCGYHGWHDWYLSANLKNKNNLNAHLIKGLSTKGVPKSLAGTSLPFRYNDFDGFYKLIKKNPDIGIVKMEVARNDMPHNNFLEKVREITSKKGIILIFDECTSGFRQTYGGLHKFYKVNPDMAIFGKALGNGYAINAIIGKEEIMRYAEETFISSTFWTERIGPTAALKTLEEMKTIKSWNIVTNKGNWLRRKWLNLAKKNNLKIKIFGIPALSRFEIISNNFDKYRTFISQEMYKKSILASNTIYVSTAHTKQDFQQYLNTLDNIFKIIARCEDGEEIDNFLEVPMINNFFKRLN